MFVMPNSMPFFLLSSSAPSEANSKNVRSSGGKTVAQDAVQLIFQTNPFVRKISVVSILLSDRD